MTIASAGLERRNISAIVRFVFGVWWITPFDRRYRRSLIERQRLGIVMNELAYEPAQTEDSPAPAADGR
jgi:hypothetical protein